MSCKSYVSEEKRYSIQVDMTTLIIIKRKEDEIMSDNSLERMRAIRYGRLNVDVATEAENKPYGTRENEDGSYSEFYIKDGEWKEVKYRSKSGKKITANDVAKKKNQSGFENEEKIDANDAGNTRSDTESEKSPAEKASLFKEFGDLLAKIIDGIIQLFKDFFDKNSLKVEYMLRNDEGFLKDYAEAKRKYKPSEGQEVLIYPNIDQKKVFDPAQKLKQHIKTTIQDLRSGLLGEELPKDHILAMSAEEYKNAILDITGCPNKQQVKTINEWYGFLKNSALGKKQKVVIRPGDVPKYEDHAIKSANALRGVVAADKNDVTELTNEMNRAFQAVSSNKNLSDEVRNRAKRYANRAKELLGDYKSLEDIAYTVYATKIQQARLILGRMFNF